MIGAPRLPAAVLSAAALGEHERVLAVAPLPDGWTFATTHRLHVVTTLAAGGEPDTAKSVHWTDVMSATTVPSERALDLRLVDGARWLVPVGTKPRRLPETVRERVQNSIVHARLVEAHRGKGVHVVVRRTPEQVMFLQTTPDPGVDVGEPGLAARVTDTVAGVRAELGLPASG